jgi:hypothetical protein
MPLTDGPAGVGGADGVGEGAGLTGGIEGFGRTGGVALPTTNTPARSVVLLETSTTWTAPVFAVAGTVSLSVVWPPEASAEEIVAATPLKSTVAPALPRFLQTIVTGVPIGPEVGVIETTAGAFVFDWEVDGATVEAFDLP